MEKQVETDSSEQRGRIEEKLDSLRQQLNKLAEDTQERLKANENRQLELERQQQRMGRPNAGGVSTAVAIISLIGMTCVAFINMKIGPVESSISALASDYKGIQANSQRTEDDRHRDQAELDIRLQREMRLVADVIAKQGDATKDMLVRDEKRIDDVTYRFDKSRDDERMELLELRKLLYKKALGE